MSKVRVTIEWNGTKQEYDCDVVIMGGANIEQVEDNYPRIAVKGAMVGNADLLSVNRIYATLGGIVHDNNIKKIYGVGRAEALEIVEGIAPKNIVAE